MSDNDTGQKEPRFGGLRKLGMIMGPFLGLLAVYLFFVLQAPSSFARNMPVTSMASLKIWACATAFWPAVASSTSSTSCGASGSFFLILHGLNTDHLVFHYVQDPLSRISTNQFSQSGDTKKFLILSHYK